MKKSYEWHTEIDGVERTIICDVAGSKFYLYVDDDCIATIYEKTFQNFQEGLEERVEICGHECRFVTWNGTPDVAVDGYLLGAGMSYEEKKRSLYRSLLSGSAAETVVGALAIVAFGIGVFVPVAFLRSAALLLVGLFFCVHGVVKAVRYRAWLRMDREA